MAEIATAPTQSGVRLGIVVDTARCIGCETCAMACKFENNLPNGVWWNRQMTFGGDHMDTPAGVYPNLSMGFATMTCQHCANPACVAACPTGASYIREDGIVLVNYDECIGCQACIAACPFEGVRTYIEEEPTYAVSHAVGGRGVQQHRASVVEKCTMCHQRVDAGRNPACVDNCPARARLFGDLNDPDSMVSRALASRESFRMQEDAGTEPQVYYLS